MSDPLCVPVSAEMAEILLAVLVEKEKPKAGTLPKGAEKPEVGQVWDSEIDQLFVGAVAKKGKDYAVLVTVVHDYTGESELGASSLLMWSDVMEAGYELIPEDGDEEEDDDGNEEDSEEVNEAPIRMISSNRWRPS